MSHESDRPECCVCKFWDPVPGAETTAGLCRRYMPQRVAGHEGLWPTTGPEDWCHFFVKIGGIPGGRGSRLTNAEILSAIERAGGMTREDLEEKLGLNGLSPTMARDRIEKLLGAGCLAEQDGHLSVTGAPPVRVRGKPLVREPTHTLEPFRPRLAMLAGPETPAGFNQLFEEANDILNIGKSAFTRIIQQALRDGKIFRYDAGKFAGLYYFDAEIDPP